MMTIHKKEKKRKLRKLLKNHMDYFFAAPDYQSPRIPPPSPGGRGHGDKTALSRCEGGPQRALLVMKPYTGGAH